MSTLQTQPTHSDLPGMQAKLRGRLAQLGAKLRMRIALDSAVRGLAVLLGLLALSLVLDFWLELSRPMRVFYWLITLAAAAHFLYHYGYKPLRKKLSPIELAEAEYSGAVGMHRMWGEGSSNTRTTSPVAGAHLVMFSIKGARFIHEKARGYHHAHG